MKHLVQYTEAELVALVAKDLAARGHTVDLREFGVEFVTGSSGTSALVSGMLEANVQEPVSQGGDDEEPDDEVTRITRMVTRDTVRVVLNKDGHTVDQLVELVLEELEESGADIPEEEEPDVRKQVRVFALMLLQELEKCGAAEYVDDGDLWCKKTQKAPRKLPKVTKLSTAAEILGGDGGVLDRSDALGEGVSEESPRAPKKRPRRRKVGGGGRGGGRGGGTPFIF